MTATTVVNARIHPLISISSSREMPHALLVRSSSRLQIGQQQAERRARNRQEQRFGDEQPDDAPPARAERGSEGDLARAAGRLGQQQVRQVDARDEQQEPDGAEQHPERAARVVAGDGSLSGAMLPRHPVAGVRITLARASS